MNSRIIFLSLCFASIMLPQILSASTIQLPKTGMTLCYDAPSTGWGTTISCAGTGQDGEFQKGIAWPSPRFTEQVAGTVKDNLTGLIWSKNARIPGPSQCNPGTTKTWKEALTYVACLNTNAYLTFSDWRMPNINEMKSLVDVSQSYPSLTSGHPFTNVLYNYNHDADSFWSSTTTTGSPGQAFNIYMETGVMNSTNKETPLSVWPVRGGTGGAIQLPRTGQTTCYHPDTLASTPCAGTGQDGDKLKGAVWPHPRFSANGDSTMTDNLTGLIWPAADVVSTAPPACGIFTPTWLTALTNVACLNANNFLTHNDWRLPNFNEMSSLTNYEEASPAAWLTGSQGFASFFATMHWTSTTHVNDPQTSMARVIDMYTGQNGALSKTIFQSYFMPVRGGNYTPSHLLTLTFAGNGAGSVNSNPTGINCSSIDPYCASALYPASTPVTLNATPGFSAFGGWAGCNSVNGTACTVNMTGPKTVTATFTSLPPKVINPRISTSQGYQTLQDGFNAAFTDDTLKALAADFTENLIINGATRNPFNVKLFGGYNPDFTSVSGTSIIHGKIIIQAGYVSVKNIAIR